MNDDWEPFAPQDIGWSKRKRALFGCLYLILVAALVAPAVVCGGAAVFYARDCDGDEGRRKKEEGREGVGMFKPVMTGPGGTAAGDDDPA